MKKIFTILFFLNSFQFVYSQSGWFKQSPLPTGNSLTDLKFVNSSTGYILGSFGILLKTTDGGIFWFVKDTCISNHQLTSIDFKDENNGLLVGDSGLIMKTSDGGVSWYQINSNTNRWLGKIQISKNNVVYIVGDSGTVLKSTNSGNNWNTIFLPYMLPLVSLYFVDDLTGYALGKFSYVFRTTNGGLNWVQQLTNSTLPNSIFMIDSYTGYIVGGSSASSISKTSDGGNNWILQYSSGRGLRSVYFTNSVTGYAVGYNGTIITTSDGGNNWLFRYTDLIEDLGGIFCTDINSAYIVGSLGTIEKTTDRGITWESQFSGSIYNLSSICFPSINIGYSIGWGNGNYGRSLIKTNNSGINWHYVYLPGIDEWQKVYFLNNSIGFVGGRNGYLYKTIDGGNNWNDYSLTGSEINDIYFLDTSNGFLTGGDINSGSIYKTSNGGVTWILKTNFGGTSIKFINNLTGFLCGSISGNNYIYKSTDGGDNWVYKFPLTNQYLKSIFFTDYSNGYICGGNDYGVIIKTTNSGENWHVVYSNSDYKETLNSIYFTNQNTGYAVGGWYADKNIIIKTTNAGGNWYSLNSSSNLELKSIFFINDTIGYLCGLNGIILKTTTGGLPISVKKILSHYPQSFKLEQNYPNPFNPKTFIIYELPSYCYVKLIIYNILGKKIAILVNQKQSSGRYSVEWDASKFASGIYFYQLRTNNFEESRKLVLLK